MVLPEELEIEYDNFTTKMTKNMAEMNKMKVAPGMKRTADAIYLGVF